MLRLHCLTKLRKQSRFQWSAFNIINHLYYLSRNNLNSGPIVFATNASRRRKQCVVTILVFCFLHIDTNSLSEPVIDGAPSVHVSTHIYQESPIYFKYSLITSNTSWPFVVSVSSLTRWTAGVLATRNCDARVTQEDTISELSSSKRAWLIQRKPPFPVSEVLPSKDKIIVSLLKSKKGQAYPTGESGAGRQNMCW